MGCAQKPETMRRLVAKEADAGVRADKFVAEKYSKFSRSALLALFNKQLVTLNGKAVKPGQKIRKGDTLNINDILLTAQPKKIDLPIIYQDTDVIVINKPSGVLTHSKGALNSEPTVASFIGDKISKELQGNRAGIIHRLDRDTSGVIICAKNMAAQTWLQKQFSERKVQKHYLAIVEGQPKPAQALIDAPIARNPKNPRSFMVSSSGKSAQTEYQVTRSIQRDGKTFSLLALKPITGRTHQLRVHLKYLGRPVVGDSFYGNPDSNFMLHASRLKLTLPSGQRKIFSAPAPDYFGKFLK